MEHIDGQFFKNEFSTAKLADDVYVFQGVKETSTAKKQMPGNEERGQNYAMNGY
jgi:hypothetical protein